MRLKMLGCSGGISAGNRTTCYGVGDHVLLDCGTGVGALRRDEMCAVRHVFLTHTHVDHVLGLPLLLDTVFDCVRRPLVVHGQPETIKALKEHILNWTIWPDFAELPNSNDPVLAYEPMEPGDEVVVEGHTVTMIPVSHVVPTAAYVVSKEGRTFCFSGDTGPNDTLWEGLNALDRLDLLLIECAFPNSHAELCRLAKHYCPRMLAEDLAKLRHRPRVVITHMKPGGEETTWRECQEEIEGFDLVRARQDETYQV
jgi:ribonuclease BN (tRNA processing enzyme)